MTRYVLRRLLQVPLGLLIVGSLAFVLIHLAPGGPVTALSGEYATAELRQEIEARYGLDRPLDERYLVWLRAASSGDLGRSYLYKAPVTTIIVERLPATLALVLPAALLSVLLGAAIGLWSTPPPGHRRRFLGPLLVLLGHLLPTFWVAQGLVLLFALTLGWLPVQGLDDPRASTPALVDRVRHLVLPVTALTLHQLAMTALILRAALGREVGRPYMTTAQAKGLDFAQARRRHALVNALQPVLAVLGGRIGSMFVGAVAIETVFALPGLGRLIVSAAVNRDHPLVLGIALSVCAVAMLGNLVTDLVMNRIDPRMAIHRADPHAA
ncbi:ABC transporter permease [Reyranella sp.]|uniref:ABC transporter permease n=1 Tax=Reyranella sp. TaxID=1929291 RepID=UPI003BAC71DD